MEQGVMDIVERLRYGPVWGDGSSIGSVVGEINGATMNEAADEIERLRKELSETSDLLTIAYLAGAADSKRGS